jgi:hypothetical protein
MVQPAEGDGERVVDPCGDQWPNDLRLSDIELRDTTAASHVNLFSYRMRAREVQAEAGAMRCAPK